MQSDTNYSRIIFVSVGLNTTVQNISLTNCSKVPDFILHEAFIHEIQILTDDYVRNHFGLAPVRADVTRIAFV